MSRPTVVLGVTGSIAAFRAVDVVRGLASAGCDVHCVLTENGARFVGPITFSTLSGNPVVTDLWEGGDSCRPVHIDLADRADVFAIAPATAHALARLVHGLADDALGSIALATEAPVVVAPAMNVHMWDHPATRANCDRLRERGVIFVGPGTGNLACGYEGRGRMAEPADVVDAIVAVGHDGPPPVARAVDGRALRVLVTAGPTREPLDLVRALTNRSSGRMGYAVAAAARDAGAEVTLVTGPCALAPPTGVDAVPVETAAQMADAVLSRFDDCDLLIMAAAVADYAPADPVNGKRRRDGEPWDLRLDPAPDILAAAVARRGRQTIVGFAAETGDLERAAADKLRRKEVDLIVANDVTRPGVGFDTDTNEVLILDRDGGREEVALAPKSVVARRIVRRALDRHLGGSGGGDG